MIIETILYDHCIECTGLGEVTCRGCRDKGWMSWHAYHAHLVGLIRAELGNVESEGWASYAAECERHKETTHRAVRAEDELAEHAREWRHVGLCDGCTDYPEETCPQHDQIERANQAEAEVARLRAGIEELIGPGTSSPSKAVRRLKRKLRSLLQKGDHDASLAGREEQ